MEIHTIGAICVGRNIRHQTSDQTSDLSRKIPLLAFFFHTHARTHAHMLAREYTNTGVNVGGRAHTRTYVHVYTHTHMDTHTQNILWHSTLTQRPSPSPNPASTIQTRCAQRHPHVHAHTYTRAHIQVSCTGRFNIPKLTSTATILIIVSVINELLPDKPSPPTAYQEKYTLNAECAMREKKMLYATPEYLRKCVRTLASNNSRSFDAGHVQLTAPTVTTFQIGCVPVHTDSMN